MNILEIQRLRTKLTKMTTNQPFDLIKCYAVVQLVARCVSEGGWKYPHAAFKNEKNSAQILGKLQFSNFNRNFFDSPDYMNDFSEIYDMLQAMSLKDFMREFLPDYITQPDCAFDILEKVRYIEYRCLALILAKMDWLNSIGDSFDYESYSEKVRSIFTKEEWVRLDYAVNCYRLDYSSTVKKAAHDANMIFVGYNCPAEYQIALYGDVREKLVGSWTGKRRSWQNYISNGAHYIRKINGLNPKIDALDMDRAINKAAERIGNIEVATDFLQAVLVDSSNNDSKVENGFVLPKFLGRLSDNDTIAIINPSPDFLCQYPERFMAHTTFVVPYEPMAWVLSNQFLTATFIPYKDFGVYADHQIGAPTDEIREFSKVLMFTRQLSGDQINSLGLRAYNAIKEDGTFFAALPAEYVAGETVQSMFNALFTLKKIDLLPQRAFKSAPKKKVYVEAAILAEEAQIQITDHEYFYGADGKTYLKKGLEEPVLVFSEMLRTPKSIYTVYREQISSRPAENRKHPHSSAFTPEIYFWYTVSTSSSKTFGHKVEAYTCYLPTDAQRKRQLFGRGNKVKGAYASVSRFNDQDDIDDWLENTLPFKPSIHRGVLEAFKKGEGRRLLDDGHIALKTLWYLQLDVDKMADSPQTNAEKDLFFSSVGSLCLDAEPEIFAEEMETFCADKTIEETAMYWNILCRVIAFAVKNGYLADNPVEEYASSFREKRDAAITAVRAALMKKTFRIEEERSLLDYLFTVIPGKGEYISVLIRFFTGLEPNIVSALTWGDIHAVAYTGIYQFWIYRQFKNNGEDPVPLEYSEDYRRLPIVPTLSEKLRERLDDIKKKTGLTEKELRKVQIIAKDDQLQNMETAKKVTPRNINNMSKKAVGAIGIQDIIVDLPDMDEENGTKETNLASYRGDIFRSNLRYRAIECGFTESEIQYFLGLRQTSPFGKNYCDYLNSFSQLAMYQKLCRWPMASGNCEEIRPRRNDVNFPCEVSLPSAGTSAIFEIPVDRQTGLLTIHIEGEHGFHVQMGLVDNEEG